MKTTIAIAAAFATLLGAQAAFAGPSVTHENRVEEAVAAQNAPYDNPLALFSVEQPGQSADPGVTKLNPLEDPHWGPAQDATDN